MDIPTYLSGAIFAKAHRVLRETVRQCLLRHGLTPTSWTFLGAVSNAPDGIRMVTLAEQMGVKPPLVTLMAHGLIEKGLIKRIPHHSDRRAKLLVATPEGRRFIQKIEKDMAFALTDLLQGLDTEDLKGYQKVLETIVKNGQGSRTIN